MSATRPAAIRCCATCNRSSSISIRAASRSAITAILPTRSRCATGSIKKGAICQSTTDTEVILHLVAPQREAPLRREIHRGAAPGRRRLRFRRPHQQEADRRARSFRHQAAGARQARRSLGARLRDLRARHHRRRVRARGGERRSGGDHPRGHREPPLRAQIPGAALHLRIYLFRPARLRSSAAARSTRCGKRWAGNWRARRRPMPTSSSRFPIPACRRPSAIRRNPASPSNSASSAITMSAAPSSSPSSASGSSASSSSTAPTSFRSRASASC